MVHLADRIAAASRTTSSSPRRATRTSRRPSRRPLRLRPPLPRA